MGMPAQLWLGRAEPKNSQVPRLALCTIIRLQEAKVKLFKNVQKEQKRVNIRNVFSVGLLHWLHGTCVCPAALTEAAGAVRETHFPASLENLQSSQERVKPVMCLRTPSMSNKAGGLSLQEQGDKQLTGVCLCGLEGL